MPNNTQSTPETHQEMDHIDQAILNAKTIQPGATKHAIAKSLLNVGIVNNVQTVYARFRKRDYLVRGFDEIQQNHREVWSRELMPQAIKRTRKGLKSLSDKDVIPLIQLTAKTVLGDTGSTAKPQEINIEHLERMQVIMQGVQ